MTSETHDGIYRAALDSANAELAEISVEFDKLCARKNQIQALVDALKPFVIDERAQHVAPKATAEAPSPSESAAEAPIGPKSEPQTFPADPFQRRIDHVLGIGAGIRDVRQYTRQF
jgi:hypothetical protein